MAKAGANSVEAATGDQPGDDVLLQRFTAHREQAAFAALVQRHGPMVLGVCRRVLQHEQDAEDAFPAVLMIPTLSKANRRCQPSPGLSNKERFDVLVCDHF
jgi:hypothetical protein